MKKITCLIFSILMFIGSFSSVSALEDEEKIKFANSREYYLKFCNGDFDDEESQKICSEFSDFLRDEKNNIQEKINSLQADSDEIANNLNEYLPLMKEYTEQMNSIENEILELNAEIEIYGAPVQEKTNEIIKNSEEIELIQEIQSERVNKFINADGIKEISSFILGDKEKDVKDMLNDFFQKTDLEKKESEIISQKEEEIKQLYSERSKLDEGIAGLSEMRDELVFKENAAKELKEGINKIIIEYRKQQADIESELSGYIDNFDELKTVISSISKNIIGAASSEEWALPLKSFYVSSGCWYYPKSFGGGLHLGIDLAAPKGTPIYAPANGFVLYSASSCKDDGYLGCSCGSPVSLGGNQIFIVSLVQGEMYLFTVYHMNYGTPIAAGTEVKQGDYIGQVGTTGSSTGPHAHIEIIKLNGFSTIQELLEQWDGDVSFGAGYGTKGYEKRCEKAGYEKPCRVNPEDIFNVKFGMEIE